MSLIELSIFLSSPPSQSVSSQILLSLLLFQPTMAEFLAETLERELDTGMKELVNKNLFTERRRVCSSVLCHCIGLLMNWWTYPISQGVYFQDKSIFSSFLVTSTIDLKRDKKSCAVACFLELPHFPQPFRSDADQLQVLLLFYFDCSMIWLPTPWQCCKTWWLSRFAGLTCLTSLLAGFLVKVLYERFAFAKQFPIWLWYRTLNSTLFEVIRFFEWV